MQINFTTRHGTHITEETQEVLTKKIGKLTRFFDRLTSIELVIDLQDHHHPKVDLLVSAEHKHDFVAHDKTDNLMTSVDSVVHKMEAQLKKYKQKTIDQHRDPDVKRQDATPDDETDDIDE